MATPTEPATSAIFRALRSVDVDPDLVPDAFLEPQPRGAVTRRAVAQRRSRASGLTRPLAAAIWGFLGFVAVPFSPFRRGLQ